MVINWSAWNFPRLARSQWIQTKLEFFKAFFRSGAYNYLVDGLVVAGHGVMQWWSHGQRESQPILSATHACRMSTSSPFISLHIYIYIYIYTCMIHQRILTHSFRQLCPFSFFVFSVAILRIIALFNLLLQSC